MPDVDENRSLLDQLAVATLVARERHWRDRGLWDRMIRAFHPDAVITLAWFTGGAAEFVAASRRGGRGGVTRHRLSPSVVQVAGDRAVAETAVEIETRMLQHGVEVDLVVSARYVNRVRRDDGEWRLASVDCICERDHLRPVLPGAELELDETRLAGYRSSYRFTSYTLESVGITSRADLPGDDRPDSCRPVYDLADRWLRAPRAGRRSQLDTVAPGASAAADPHDQEFL